MRSPDQRGPKIFVGKYKIPVRTNPYRGKATSLMKKIPSQEAASNELISDPSLIITGMILDGNDIFAPVYIPMCSH